MRLPPTSRALFKTLTLAAALGVVLYAGHAWLTMADPSASAGPAGAPGRPADSPLASGTSASARADRLNAREVAHAYARSPQEAEGRFKGQRLRLHGVVDQLEAGQGQILLVTLGAAEHQAGLRAVVDMGAQVDRAVRPVVGQALALECLNQGLLMGEPVLSDCHLLP